MGPPNPAIVDQAQHLKVKLDSLDTEFKTHHYAVVDTISDEGEQAKEQSEHCQRPHHTLIHKDAEAPPPQPQTGSVPVTTHTTLDLKSNALLMTCNVRVYGNNGTFVEAQAPLDCASSASFI